jgi:hypothetical protein
LQPVLEAIDARFKKLGIAENIYQQGTIVTADTGFANDKFIGNKFAQPQAGPKGESHG